MMRLIICFHGATRLKIHVDPKKFNRQRIHFLCVRYLTLTSNGSGNKEKVLALANQGVQYSKPNDILKDPYVFEFLGIPENKPMLEKDLEKALIIKIEKFLLELGRGFMFVG